MNAFFLTGRTLVHGSLEAALLAKRAINMAVAKQDGEMDKNSDIGSNSVSREMSEPVIAADREIDEMCNKITQETIFQKKIEDLNKLNKKIEELEASIKEKEQEIEPLSKKLTVDPTELHQPNATLTPDELVKMQSVIQDKIRVINIIKYQITQKKDAIEKMTKELIGLQKKQSQLALLINRDVERFEAMIKDAQNALKHIPGQEPTHSNSEEL